MASPVPSEKEKVPNDLPKVLLLGPPSVFEVYGRQFSEKFNFLKPFESSLPIHEFLSTHATTIRAMLCSGACSVTSDILHQLPALGLIVTTSAGINHIDLSECHKRGINVANAGAIFSEDVADTAVGLLIDVLRRISAANRFVKSGLWSHQGDYPLASKLGGKRVGIVGLGSIGLEVAKRLDAFGCIITYNSRKQKPLVKFLFYPDIRDLAENNDVLVICCALTDQTHHMINNEVMLALGNEGIIINVGRGSIIDESELVQCLLEGKIGGAGLDVFENEPNVPKELFHLDNVVFSPHAAVFTEESSRDLYELSCENLDAFFSSKPLKNLVNERTR